MEHKPQERYHDFILRRTREVREQEFYEACMYFYMVKGHLDTSDSTILDSKEHYFKRIWRAGCDGAPLDEWVDGFEEVYKRRMTK